MEKEQKMIYLDNAATTKTAPEVVEAMLPYFTEFYGNASTVYEFGAKSKGAISQAREQIAGAIGAKGNESYFTAGGSEADNWALKAVFEANKNKGNHIITTKIEHHAVLHTCQYLESLGCEVTYLNVDENGRISIEELERAIRPTTILISVMAANNEIGTIQPIPEIGKICRERGVLFHTDAVQAVGHILLDVKDLGVDMLSASAHKFNGPKGIGFLYVRDGVMIEPLLHGGAQEGGRRAGTENVAGIVGMATAFQEHIEHLEQETTYVQNLADLLLKGLRNTGLNFIVNGDDNRIPGSLSLSFRDADGEMLLHRLDLMGTAVATGSACDSKSTALSHVIRAIGVPDAYAHGTIRITLGMDNSIEQVSVLVEQISRILDNR